MITFFKKDRYIAQQNFTDDHGMTHTLVAPGVTRAEARRGILDIALSILKINSGQSLNPEEIEIDINKDGTWSAFTRYGDSKKGLVLEDSTPFLARRAAERALHEYKKGGA